MREMAASFPCANVFPMDLHRLAEERSVAYHRAIAERLRDRPEVLENARRRVQGWLDRDGEPRFYARKWAEVLADDPASIAAFLVERSEIADELRQSSPFAGALKPQERWKIWRETRERLVGPP
jgi:malate synthase